jgi:hypothetical protein
MSKECLDAVFDLIKVKAKIMNQVKCLLARSLSWLGWGVRGMISLEVLNFCISKTALLVF